MATLADLMTPREPSLGALETTEVTEFPDQTSKNTERACRLNPSAEKDSSDKVSEEATIQVRSAEGQLLLRLLRSEMNDGQHLKSPLSGRRPHLAGLPG